ncbi:hypothetical protein AB0D08_22435 [Kitasatospora sp. NPDC048540]|uniref:hypothetical protein n=1 Tax=unclassified Kitasatospora TaxID=2633591 RepID=UPI00053A9FD7|nr:hypothetical protein [Kitasatospora sp. MBT63]
MVPSQPLLPPVLWGLLGRVISHGDRLEVRWLKGHIGHDLNETADRLASLGLRSATRFVPPAEVRRVLGEIGRMSLSGVA